MPGTDRVEIRTLKVGRFCVVEDEAYKILGISTSKPGKHGSAKARLDLVSLFSSKKINYSATVTDKIHVPMIEKGTAVVSHIEGDEVHAMNMRKKLKLPNHVWLRLQSRLQLQPCHQFAAKHDKK